MHALRRHLVTFVTLLCLLGVQQVAALHELSHLTPDGKANPEKQLPHSKSCDKCAAYAELSGAAPAASALVFHIQDFAAESFSFSPQFTSSTSVWAYAARAPPHLL